MTHNNPLSKAGLFVRKLVKGSSSKTNCKGAKVFSIAPYSKTETSDASIPTLALSFTTPLSHSSTEGVPSIFIFINVIPVPQSSSVACTKYLESVHKADCSIVITSVPAEPVNPESHSLDL